MKLGAINRALWLEPSFKTLSPNAKLVVCYLLTSPYGNSVHLFRVGPSEIALACTLTPRAVQAALADIAKTGLVAFDSEHELVWLEAQMLAELGREMKPSDNRVRFIRKLLEDLPASPLVSDFLARYGLAYHLKTKGPSKGPCKGASDPLRSQGQGQGQEEDLTNREDPLEEGSSTTPRARGVRLAAGGES